jgi:uncharacterized protein YlxP (DUF503 family)
VSGESAIVGVLHLRFRLPSRTLKEKRSIVKSVVERVRNRYNVSAAEAASLDSPEIACIVIACVSNSRAHADTVLQEIARFVSEERLDAELLGIGTELVTL